MSHYYTKPKFFAASRVPFVAPGMVEQTKMEQMTFANMCYEQLDVSMSKQIVEPQMGQHPMGCRLFVPRYAQIFASCA